MTSVGFGDITATNNSERVFVIMLEVIGGFLFGLIIASLTSVVTGIDINVQKVQEETDAVKSFVAKRNLSPELSCQVRRHFREYYEKKTAIDERKIFESMSPKLRFDVSEYIVSEQMGSIRLFQYAHPKIWPTLLYLLRPLRFEKSEIVCEEGDESIEM